ncbi:hypothetical protein F4782DRAFT_250426 [Xylaria castorea]|nr:hypothetical protein F4782DRAFT_250426 [Xylaria castorea]
MSCFESVYNPLDKLHTKKKSKTYEHLRNGIFGGNRKIPFGKLVRDEHRIIYTFCQYLSNVEAYSARNLRYDEDALNAFQGIILRFSKPTQCLRNFWGLLYLDNCEQGASYFVWSLTWRHKAGSRLRRRQNYPIWTWVGWEGEVEYNLIRVSSKLWFDDRVRALGFENSKTGNVIELHELRSVSQESCSYTVLHITAVVVPPGYISYQPTKDAAWPWVIAKHEAKLSSLYNAKYNIQLAESLKDTSTWQCVYIGGLFKTMFIMILKLNSITDTWERAGMFYVHTFAHTMDLMFTDLGLGRFRIE